MKFHYEPPCVFLLLSALVACSEPSLDEGATTTSPSETDDEVGTSDSTTETSDGTTETATETGTETETETETGEPPDPICGNAMVEGPELCDDGNMVDDDGCSNACEPRLCPITWSRVSDEPTIASAYLDNTPLVELPDGNIAVANTLDGASSIDVRVQVWTPDGELVWEVVHAFGDLRDGLGDLLADPSGDIFLGAGANVGTDGVAKVVRLSGVDGSILWTFENDGSTGIDRTNALAFDDQNRVLVAMQGGGKSGETDVVVHAIDPMTGISEWDGQWTSSGNHDDWPTGIGFDADTGRIWVAASTYIEGDPPTANATLLAFVPPTELPELVVVPVEDGIPDYDTSGPFVHGTDGRLWVSVDDYKEDAEYVEIAEIDGADGSTLTVLDSRDMAIDGEVHRSWQRGQLGGLAGGGLALIGWTITDPDLGIEPYGYMVALDAEGQHDCVARMLDDTTALPFGVLGASTGAIFVNGFVQQSGDFHSMLVRIR